MKRDTFWHVLSEGRWHFVPFETLSVETAKRVAYRVFTFVVEDVQNTPTWQFNKQKP
jgi:hypothetical protein